jgi:outer membrane lipoprotein-sorting protein
MTANKVLQKLCVSMLLCVLPALGQAAEWQVGDLMRLLAQTKSGHATFIEKKYIGIVDKPVESSGDLFFTTPDKLEKRTLKPHAESMILDGKRLIIDRAGKKRLNLDLGDYPEAAAFVDSIRGTLAGDLTALDKVYTLTLHGTSTQWQLILQPRYSRMSDVIRRIAIQGSKGDISRIDFDMADGDRSEMSVTKVAVQQ